MFMFTFKKEGLFDDSFLSVARSTGGGTYQSLI